MSHRVYSCIVSAVKADRLKEPFTKTEFRNECPDFKPGTYNAFLDKHALGNPGRNSELFERVSPGKFKCLRPFKYDLEE